MTAVEYAEKYGIVEYKTQGNMMCYYTSYPTERRTFKTVINLDTGEVIRSKVRNYYKPMARIGKIQVNGRW